MRAPAPAPPHGATAPVTRAQDAASRVLGGVDVDGRGTDVRRRLVVESIFRRLSQDAEGCTPDLVAAVSKLRHDARQVGCLRTDGEQVGRGDVGRQLVVLPEEAGRVEAALADRLGQHVGPALRACPATSAAISSSSGNGAMSNISPTVVGQCLVDVAHPLGLRLPLDERTQVRSHLVGDTRLAPESAWGLAVPKSRDIPPAS